ncbi:MAG: glycoside hydrolase family 97 protein [Asticcacaulis sp.]|nr:glycoside hydrolase family 97 protein [Asticcacaulis sp.]
MSHHKTMLTAVAVALLAAGTLALIAQPAAAADSDIVQRPPVASVIATAESPNHLLSVDVSLDVNGSVGYSVKRMGKEVIAPSRLGLILTNAFKLDRNFTLDTTSTTSHDDTWEQPWGEWKTIRNNYTELTVTVAQKKLDNRKMTVVFRIYDDGIGFRYEFPDQPQLKHLSIVDELTEFAVDDDATAWWNAAGEWNREEYPVDKTPLREVSLAQTPLTVKTGDGLYIAFHEAALVDYPGMWLRRVNGQRLKAQLAPTGEPGAKNAEVDAPFSTPWRTMIIADSAPGLYMSHLELNLDEPNKLGDVSWFKPNKYVGIWWEMHLGNATWEAGPKHGATTENTRKYIDFAAANGFRGVLVEGWNKGWEDWFATGYKFSFTEAYPDFDLPALSAYGLKKGVHLIGHNETGGNAGVYEPQMDAGFAQYEKYGVDSVKTGYVADAGGAQLGPVGNEHFTWNDSQEMVRHFQKVVTEAAKYHIAIDTHEPIKDTGLRRTYPNWVSREGQRGMEYNAWGSPPNMPEHDSELFFTRMLGGPMDYTPGVLSLQGNNQPINSTQARQLALYVVIYSPIQMAADLPENYAKYPGPFQFIKDVVTNWSDTRVLNGEPGDFVTVARKDRNSDQWFLGSVTDENGRAFPVTLEFLDPGRKYTAEIYRDGANADYTGDARFDIVIEKKVVTGGDTFPVRLAPGGGLAVRFVPAGPAPKTR